MRNSNMNKNRDYATLNIPLIKLVSSYSLFFQLEKSFLNKENGSHIVLDD